MSYISTGIDGLPGGISMLSSTWTCHRNRIRLIIWNLLIKHWWRLRNSAYVLWQNVHSNGRSIKCVAQCSFSLYTRWKRLPHLWHSSFNLLKSMGSPWPYNSANFALFLANSILLRTSKLIVWILRCLFMWAFVLTLQKQSFFFKIRFNKINRAA